MGASGKMYLKIIFLDIDNVANKGVFNYISMSHTLTKSCVLNLNKIIHETKAKVVISSSWRYMIEKGAITKLGFEYLLRTHGVTNEICIIGTTPLDEIISGRENQINYWLNEYNHQEPIESYVILDDDISEIDVNNPNFVVTKKGRGLTLKNSTKAIKILNQYDLNNRELLILKLLNDYNTKFNKEELTKLILHRLPFLLPEETSQDLYTKLINLNYINIINNNIVITESGKHKLEQHNTIQKLKKQNTCPQCNGEIIVDDVLGRCRGCCKQFIRSSFDNLWVIY